MSTANDDPRDASAETKFKFPESWQADTPGAYLHLFRLGRQLIMHHATVNRWFDCSRCVV